MSTVLVIPNPDGVATTITVDATPEQTHSHRAKVTENPVEEGADTSDHYRSEADRFSLALIFSDTPVVPYPDFTDGVTFTNSKNVLVSSGGKSARTQRVYDLLLKLMDDGTLIEVITANRRYVNVAIEKLDVKRVASMGTSFQPRMECRALRIPRTTTAEAPVPVRPRARNLNNAGNRNGTNNSSEGDASTSESIWHRVTN